MSVLGSLLFFIYVNDMPQAVMSTVLLYADISCTLYQHKDIVQIENDSVKTLKLFVSGLLITILVFILLRIRQNLILFASKRGARNIHDLNINLKT